MPITPRISYGKIWPLQGNRGMMTRPGEPPVLYGSTSAVNVTQGPRNVGYNNPEWQIQVSKRVNASTAYQARYIRFRNKAIKQDSTFYHPSWRGNIVGSCDLYLAPILGSYLAGVEESEDASTKDLAVARLKRKLAERSNQMNLLVPLAEIKELRGLIRSLCFSALDLVKMLLEIKRSKGRSAAKFASHAWLTFSFGLKPTVDEIQQLTSTINDIIMESGGENFTDYGAARKTWKSSVRGTISSTAYCNSKWYGDMSHKLTYRAVAGYKTPIRSANVYDVADSLGLSFASLPAVGWELTPFSWIVDYFTTTGAFLDDTFTSDGNTIVYCNVTSKYVCKGVYSASAPDISAWPRGSSTGGGSGSSFEWTFVNRQNLGTTIPNRTLRFKTADEITNNAKDKLLNLASVLVGGKAFSNRIS